MKHWKAYHPSFIRIMLEAAAGGYRAELGTKAQAWGIVRLSQKLAASIRRDPADASPEMRAAAAFDTGGVLWTAPRLENGSWVIIGAPRPRKPASMDYLADRLP